MDILTREQKIVMVAAKLMKDAAYENPGVKKPSEIALDCIRCAEKLEARILDLLAANV